MDIRSEELGPRLLKVTLDGRLDTPGVDQVEARFNAVAVSSGKEALIDLGAVSFVSSMGIRMFITAARAMRQRQARIVLFGAQPLVAETLQTMSVDTVMAVVADEAAARALVAA